MKDLREIVKFESYDAACKKYVDDLHYIIKNNRKFQDKLPVLMLSGGIDSMMLGCILKKYFELKDSITVGCVHDTDDIKVSQDTASKLGIDNNLILTAAHVVENATQINIEIPWLGREKYDVNLKTLIPDLYNLIYKLLLKNFSLSFSVLILL